MCSPVLSLDMIQEPPFRMRRLTPLLLLVGLSGCTGFGEFLDHAFSPPGTNPNIPMADSENVRRALGMEPAIQPLEVEPGNVWPRFDTRDPTLEDVANHPERENQRGFPPTSVPGEQSGLPARPPAPTLPSRQFDSTGQRRTRIPRAPQPLDQPTPADRQSTQAAGRRGFHATRPGRRHRRNQ